MRRINAILRRNRRILEELNPHGKSRVPRDKLVMKGYNFQYHTHSYTSRTGNTYHFCYEYGYMLPEGPFMTLVKRDGEME